MRPCLHSTLLNLPSSRLGAILYVGESGRRAACVSCHPYPCPHAPMPQQASFLDGLGEQASCGLQAFNLALSQPLPKPTHSAPHNNLAPPSSSIDSFTNLINYHLSPSAPLIPCITRSASIATQDTPPALSTTRPIHYVISQWPTAQLPLAAQVRVAHPSLVAKPSSNCPSIALPCALTGPAQLWRALKYPDPAFSGLLFTICAFPSQLPGRATANISTTHAQLSRMPLQAPRPLPTMRCLRIRLPRPQLTSRLMPPLPLQEARSLSP